MKKMITLLLAAVMLLSLTACSQTSSGGTAAEEATLGHILMRDFQERAAEDPDASAQELAEGVLSNEEILFEGGAVAVEPGLLTGFGNAEITGFEEGVMFAPMIGTIPFVGYVFDLPDGADGDAFMQTLKDNADPRWNICTEAEETVVKQEGDKVFFLMCPASLEES